MDRNVLVAYASKHGATAEIAMKIGTVLSGEGLKVDVLPVKYVPFLHPYHAAVVGSASYMYKWRPEAVGFIKDNLAMLATMPTWFFSSGPSGKGDALDLVKGEKYPRSLNQTMETIRPRDVAVFHGFINMKALNAFERLAFRRATDMQGDFRDWAVIVDWAKAIAKAIKQEDYTQFGFKLLGCKEMRWND